MPELKVGQNTARRELLALKSLPTKVMTASQQKLWDRLVEPNKDGVRLIDLYYKKFAEYQQKYIRNVNRYNHFQNVEKRYGNHKEFVDYLDRVFGEALDEFKAEYGRDPVDAKEFDHFFATVYFREDDGQRYNNFYKQFPQYDAKLVPPPGLVKHVNEYIKNKQNGDIQIIKDMGAVKASQIANKKQDLINKKANKTYALLSPDEIEGILYGKTVKSIDNSDNIKVSNNYGKGLMELLPDDEGPEAQAKRFELMKKEIAGFSGRIQAQIAKAILEDERDFDDVEDHLYDPKQLMQFIREVQNKNESTGKEYKMKSLTETFLDLIGKRLDSDSLKEDDSPADFATGLNNAVTSQSGVDMSTSDTSSSSSTSTKSTNSSSSSDSDFDYAPDSGEDLGGGFGDITGPNGSVTIPDDDSEASMAIPQADYKVVDILVNDKDTSQVKVKIQNTETKEIETVDLSDIDV